VSLDLDGEVAALEVALRGAGSPDRAVGEKAYLKSELDFFGTDLASIRGSAKAFKRAHADLTHEELLGLVAALWMSSVFELRAVGVALLEQYTSLLVAQDMATVEDLVRRSNTWAFVDWLSTKIAGSLVERYPETKRILRRWAMDDNFWVRRASLLALHDALRAGRGDFPLFAELAAPMVEEREFFIRKAIGWVLREVSKKRPELTYGFLKEQIDRVSGLTLHEGAKYLPAEQREELMARYRERTGRKRG